MRQSVLIVFLILPIYLAAANNGNARIAIINFIDDSENKNYQWLSKSLPDAIDKTMHDNFIFDRINIEKNNEVSQDLFENAQDFYLINKLRAFCQNTKVDLSFTVAIYLKKKIKTVRRNERKRKQEEILKSTLAFTALALTKY